MAEGAVAVLAGGQDVSAELERLLDRAVLEVFGTMLGVECAQAEAPDWGDEETIAALIGLAGAMTGSLVLQSEARAGMRVAELMTGVGPEEVDSTTRDALSDSIAPRRDAKMTDEERQVGHC